MIDLLRTRRSIRKYAQKPIESKTVDVLVEALLRSPTSRNGKSWEFLVVDDRDLLSKLSKAREQPIGSFWMGVIAQRVGSGHALQVGGLFCVVGASTVYFLGRKKSD